MLHVFTQNDINTLVNSRDGETKLGEKITLIDSLDTLQNNSSKFVILGVPEDIGVRMNGGRSGANTAFFPTIKALLNIQENQFINGRDILMLGYLDFLDTVNNFTNNDAEKGDYLVKQIDKELSNLIQLIVEADKIPVIIGGGHNNAYGNIKGLSMAKKQAVNVVNFDAHTDLRQLEERHSGNGFSYAFHNGFLDCYFMFGLHEMYTPQYIFDAIHKNINFEYNTFEELTVYKSVQFEKELQRALKFVNNKPFGVEVDLDAIQYFPSSAMSPTGFSPRHARRFVHCFGSDDQASYLHICEGAPILSNQADADVQVGKFITYLITDFIKAHNSK